MTQTQTEPSNDSKQVKCSSVPFEDKPAEPQPNSKKPLRRIPKPIRIMAAIALLAGVGYGVYQSTCKF